MAEQRAQRGAAGRAGARAIARAQPRAIARAPPRATNVADLHYELCATPHFVRVFALRRPKPEGYRLVNVTSKSAEPIWRQLSPFNLGPVEVRTPRGVFAAANVENAWQYSKVYAVGPDGEPFVDADGAPNDRWYAWARAGWARRDAVRFPMGRGARPLYSLGVEGEDKLVRLPYIEARKRLYAPWYAATAAATPAYAELAAMCAAVERAAAPAVPAVPAVPLPAVPLPAAPLPAAPLPAAPLPAAPLPAAPLPAAPLPAVPFSLPIGLVDFDGWDHIGQGYSLAEALNAPHPKFGHAFVIAGMLTGDRCWE